MWSGVGESGRLLEVRSASHVAVLYPFGMMKYTGDLLVTAGIKRAGDSRGPQVKWNSGMITNICLDITSGGGVPIVALRAKYSAAGIPYVMKSG